jgi:hypothetical protein
MKPRLPSLQILELERLTYGEGLVAENHMVSNKGILHIWTINYSCSKT